MEYMDTNKMRKFLREIAGMRACDRHNTHCSSFTSRVMPPVNGEGRIEGDDWVSGQVCVRRSDFLVTEWPALGC